MIDRVSSQAPALLLRTNVMSLQRALTQAHDEVSSGRRADLGEALGVTFSHNEASRVRIAALAALDMHDDVAAARVDAISTTLSGLRANAGKLRDQLVAAAQSPQTRAGLIETAKGFLSAYTAAMGQDMAGVALFGGSELSAPAVAGYDETRATGPAAAIAAAFQSAFGFTQDDPAVSTIDATALGAFLDGDFAAQFAQPAWSANWSRATDDAFRTQIAPGERVATTVSANEGALRDMARLAVMVADLGADKLNDSAFTVFAEKAASLATSATDATMSLETRMGVSRQRITDAQIAMDATRNMLTRQIGASEDVDPAEAAMRINDLTSRLEATFAVTARLRDLSLLNYL